MPASTTLRTALPAAALPPTPFLPTNSSPTQTATLANGCVGYTLTLSSPQTSPLTLITTDDARAVASLSAPRLSTIFLDAKSLTTWLADTDKPRRLVDYLTGLATTGIHRVILQNIAAWDSAQPGFTAAYPQPNMQPPLPFTPTLAPDTTTQATWDVAQVPDSTTTPSPTKTNILQELLTAASDEHVQAAGGVRIVVGLLGVFGATSGNVYTTGTNNSNCILTVDQPQLVPCHPSHWMLSRAAVTERVAWDAVQVVKNYPQIFDGWYLPQEYDTGTYTQLQAAGVMAWLTQTESAFVENIDTTLFNDPTLPIIASVFLSDTSRVPCMPKNSALTLSPRSTPKSNCAPVPYNNPTPNSWVLPNNGNTPCTFTKLVTTLIAHSHLTELLLQDGKGDKQTPDIARTNFRLWAEALAEAASTKNLDNKPVTAGIDVDLYTPTTASSDLSPTQLRNTLVKYSSFGLDLVGFGLSHLHTETTSNSTGVVTASVPYAGTSDQRGYRDDELSSPTHVILTPNSDTRTITLSWQPPRDTSAGAPTLYVVQNPLTREVLCVQPVVITSPQQPSQTTSCTLYPSQTNTNEVVTVTAYTPRGLGEQSPTLTLAFP